MVTLKSVAAAGNEFVSLPLPGVPLDIQVERAVRVVSSQK